MLLVVDDDQPTRVLLVRLMALEGYEAIGVSSGAEALLYCRTHKPALIVLDHDMPQMDGLAVFAELKRDPLLQNIPVIMFSANGHDLAEKALRSGVNAYVRKGSLDWADLHGEIIRLVGRGTHLPPPRDIERPRSKDIA